MSPRRKDPDTYIVICWQTFFTKLLVNGIVLLQLIVEKLKRKCKVTQETQCFDTFAQMILPGNLI